jgi:prepilin-type processing-associated H-X9-DG protein
MPTNGTKNTVIVLREKEAWQSVYGQWAKTYAFADGHSEIHVEADGDFNAFEARHAAAPSLP